MHVGYCSCGQQPGLNVLRSTGKTNSDLFWMFMKMQLTWESQAAGAVTGVGSCAYPQEQGMGWG